MRVEKQNLTLLKANGSAVRADGLVNGSVDHSYPITGVASSKDAEPEPFVDAEQAAHFLRLQRRRVLQLARQAALPAYPIGDGVRRIWRFRLSELADAMLHLRQRSHVPEKI